MFNSKTRPAPSKATLRLLYQLAYVSSGTAAGIATLCAEERRRQTAIVQKIADNAKRIRQCPRYRHHAARTRQAKLEELAEQFYSDDDEGGSSVAVVLERRKSGGEERRTRFAYMGEDVRERHVRAPELPSVVEKGYGQLVEKNHKRKRRRKPGYGHDGRDEVVVKHTQTTEKLRRGVSSMRASTQLAGRHSISPPFSRSDRLTRPKRQLLPQWDSAMDRDTLLRTYIFTTKDTGRLEKDNRRSPLHLNVRPRFQIRELDRTINPTNDGQNHGGPASDAEITHDTETFFSSIPWANDMNIEASIEQTRIASKLLELTSRAGMLAETRSLCYWKVSRGFMEETDFRIVCEAFAALTKRTERAELEDIFALFMDLFSSSDFTSLSAEFRAWANMHAVSGILMWTIDGRLRNKWARTLASTGCNLDDRVAVKELENVCNRLLQEEATTPAGKLLYIVRSQSRRPLHQELANRIMEQATAHGELHITQLLLKQSFGLGYHQRPDLHQAMLRSAYEDVSLKMRLERHVQSCVQHKGFRFLQPLIILLSTEQRKMVRWVEQLSDQTKRSMAIACTFCTPFPRSFFDRLYTSIPNDQREAVDDSYQVHQLRETWFATRDLQTVWKQYDEIKSWQARTPGQPAFGSAEITLMDICALAGQPHRGMALVRSLRNPDGSLDSASLSLAALTLASNSDWQRLKDLLTVVAASKDFVHDAFTTSKLNHVLCSYAKKHTAKEIWEFVHTDLIRGIGFRPDRGTTRFLLWAFVQKKAFALIPAWLRFLRSTGDPFCLDSRSAASLMRSFWVAVRPPHVLLMWLCRALWEQAPSLEPVHFRNTLQGAISYDLRHLGTLRTRRLADSNLEKVRSMDLEMPMPTTQNELRFDKLGRPGSVDGIQFWGIPDQEHHAVPLSQQSDSSGPKSPLAKHDTSVSSSYQPFQEVYGTNPRSTSSPETGTAPLTHQLDSSTQSSPASGHTSASLADQPFVIDHQSSDSPDEKRVLEPMSEGSRESAADRRFLNSLTPSERPSEPTLLKRPSLPNDEHGEIHTDGIETGADNNDSMDSVGFTGSLWQSEDEQRMPGLDHNAENTTNDLVEKRSGNPVQNPAHVQTLIENMVVAWSSKDYQKAVDLYYQSLTPTRLPPTPRVLEVAVEARIRLDQGQLDGAKAMMREAQEAGYNVTSAIGPLLVHEFRQLPVHQRRDANALRTKIIDYYRMNDENGWTTSHHFGVTAARELVRVGRSQHAINLLNAIYISEWAKERPFNIVAMSVYVQAYTSLAHPGGLLWVVRKVLSSDMRIDWKFINALRNAIITVSQVWVRGARSARFASLLKGLRQECIDRYIEQMRHSLMAGKRLGAVVASCVNAQDESDDVWEDIEKGCFFGYPVDAYEEVRVASDDDAKGEAAPIWQRMRRMRRLRTRRLRQAMRVHAVGERPDEIYGEEDMDRAWKEQLQDVYDRAWVEQLQEIGLSGGCKDESSELVGLHVGEGDDDDEHSDGVSLASDNV